MFHTDHSALVIIGHLMVAFLFLYRGITAFPQFDHHLSRFQERGIPFARYVLLGGFATMIVGGLMIAVDYYAWAGAAGLILFTVMANFLYHDFWTLEDPQRRQTHTWIFCNNIAVMGGLFMIVSNSL
ncbi:MAG: DoxX family protein [Rhodospirillales bacterium]|nr:DoxX family protein [Rhodospirillales bacterium]